jgi:hypothetical protein
MYETYATNASGCDDGSAGKLDPEFVPDSDAAKRRAACFGESALNRFPAGHEFFCKGPLEDHQVMSYGMCHRKAIVVNDVDASIVSSCDSFGMGRGNEQFRRVMTSGEAG